MIIMQRKPLFNRCALIGLGMMGGSLAYALRESGVVNELTGCDASEEALELAMRSEVFTNLSSDAVEAVKDADLVIIAAPVHRVVAIMEAIGQSVDSDALVTDIGSVKKEIVLAGSRIFGDRFVGGHPMCGSPQSGFTGAQRHLYKESPWLVVAESVPDRTSPYVEKLCCLIERLGSRCILLDTDRHDRLVALVSHLPHIISFSYSDLLQGDGDAEMARSLAGGSYKDLMRVAAADRELWDGIFKQNREQLLLALDAFEERLEALRDLLK